MSFESSGFSGLGDGFAGISVVSGASADGVLFGGANGILSQDSTRFKWDDTNYVLTLKGNPYATTLKPALNITSDDADYSGGIQFKFNGSTLGAVVNAGYHYDLEINSNAGGDAGNGIIYIGGSGGIGKFIVQGYQYKAGGISARACAIDATSVPLAAVGAASQTADLFQATDSSVNPLAGIDAAGRVYTRANSAPSDAAISNGQLYLWFDDTAGSAKAMFKGKNASGTVVTGSVNLT